MIEKVNPSHPDKVADRIAGAIVDLAYTKQENPKIAVEVLIGHGEASIITETSVSVGDGVRDIVERITNEPRIAITYNEVPQDAELAKNQNGRPRCGDNGIFKGVPTNLEEARMSKMVRKLYERFPTDGKFIYDEKTNVLIACQSNATVNDVAKEIGAAMLGWDGHLDRLIINPLGEWTGGTNVDTGATNRKLGSDMGRAVTGGGLHGKDLSKADVSVNIVCFILAEECHQEVEALCAIGDKEITFRRADGTQVKFDYVDVVAKARYYIEDRGGFEKFAEWGLI